MLISSNEESSFQNNIKEAVNAIKANQYELALKCLHTAMIKNDHSAEVHNLLGVISECKGDVTLACKYYRAACMFDDTYKPADKNLERVTAFFYIFNEVNIDYGHNIEKEHNKSYLLEYSAMHIGDLTKSENSIKSAC